MSNDLLFFARRKRNRLTQRDAAMQIGLPYWRYYHIERGWAVPTADEATRIASFFEMPVDRLFPSTSAPQQSVA